MNVKLLAMYLFHELGILKLGPADPNVIERILERYSAWPEATIYADLAREYRGLEFEPPFPLTEETPAEAYKRGLQAGRDEGALGVVEVMADCARQVMDEAEAKRASKAPTSPVGASDPAKGSELGQAAPAAASEAPRAVCGLCGEPMPAGEESFQYHGYSGPCPTPAMGATPLDCTFGKVREDGSFPMPEGWPHEGTPAKPEEWKEGYNAARQVVEVPADVLMNSPADLLILQTRGTWPKAAVAAALQMSVDDLPKLPAEGDTVDLPVVSVRKVDEQLVNLTPESRSALVEFSACVTPATAAIIQAVLQMPEVSLGDVDKLRRLMTLAETTTEAEIEAAEKLQAGVLGEVEAIKSSVGPDILTHRERLQTLVNGVWQAAVSGEPEPSTKRVNEWIDSCVLFGQAPMLGVLRDTIPPAEVEIHRATSDRMKAAELVAHEWDGEDSFELLAELCRTLEVTYFRFGGSFFNRVHNVVGDGDGEDRFQARMLGLYRESADIQDPVILVNSAGTWDRMLKAFKVLRVILKERIGVYDDKAEGKVMATLESVPGFKWDELEELVDERFDELSGIRVDVWASAWNSVEADGRPVFSGVDGWEENGFEGPLGTLGDGREHGGRGAPGSEVDDGVELGESNGGP